MDLQYEQQMEEAREVFRFPVPPYKRKFTVLTPDPNRLGKHCGMDPYPPPVDCLYEDSTPTPAEDVPLEVFGWDWLDRALVDLRSALDTHKSKQRWPHLGVGSGCWECWY